MYNLFNIISLIMFSVDLTTYFNIEVQCRYNVRLWHMKIKDVFFLLKKKTHS